MSQSSGHRRTVCDALSSRWPLRVLCCSATKGVVTPTTSRQSDMPASVRLSCKIFGDEYLDFNWQFLAHTIIIWRSHTSRRVLLLVLSSHRRLWRIVRPRSPAASDHAILSDNHSTAAVCLTVTLRWWNDEKWAKNKVETSKFSSKMYTRKNGQSDSIK